MPNPVFESMTKVVVFNWQIRVWREEPDMTPGPDQEVVNLIMDTVGKTDSVRTLLTTLGALPRISAVEVLNPGGDGAIFYPDWT